MKNSIIKAHFAIDNALWECYTLVCKQKKKTTPPSHLKRRMWRMLQCLGRLIVPLPLDVVNEDCLQGGDQKLEAPLTVRERLYRNHLTYKWLIDQLAARGIDTCSTTLSGIFTGARRGHTVDRILRESEMIIDRYERWNNEKI